MDAHRITCGFCGQPFDPDEQDTCSACPLHTGCGLVRCPACGFETVDPRRSTLAKWARRWFFPHKENADRQLVSSIEQGEIR